MILPVRIIAALQLVATLAQLRLAHGYDSSSYKNPHYAGDRTTMVHLFEWKFVDVAKECENFLGPVGYAGVQVSPISENVVIQGRPWYERYQPISYKIVSRSGDEDGFKNMVSRCNAVGVRVYIDLVANHMSTDLEPAYGTGDSRAKPKDLLYPAVPYGPNDFHRSCAICNYRNVTEVRDCNLNGLHDLDQSRDYVKDKIVEFVNRAIDHGIAGVRIDAAKHMWPYDLRVIYSRFKNLDAGIFGPNMRPFIYQDVVDYGDGQASNKWDYYRLAMVIESIFGKLVGGRFRGWEPLKNLRDIDSLNHNLMLSSDALVMIDNHDSQREPGVTLNYSTSKLYKMAVAFMLAYRYGHPCIMSSYKFTDRNQGPPIDDDYNIFSPNPVYTNITNNEDANECGDGWICEHRWPQIYRMIGFRNTVQGAPLINWWTNGNNQIAFSRGKYGFVAFNGESNADLKVYLRTGLPAGEYCDVISGKKDAGKCTGKTVRVKDDRTAYIEILKDEQDGVLAIHAQTKL